MAGNQSKVYKMNTFSMFKKRYIIPMYTIFKAIKHIIIYDQCFFQLNGFLLKFNIFHFKTNIPNKLNLII